MFKMRPRKGLLWAAVFIFLLGIAFYAEGHRDVSDIAAQDRSSAMLAVSIVVSGILLIVSTGRMWFRHLWHDRYK